MSEARKLGFLYHAIVEGLRRPGLQAKLLEMGAGLVTSVSNRRLRHQHRYALTRILQSFRKVRMLSETLADPEIRPRYCQVVPLACSDYGPP